MPVIAIGGMIAGAIGSAVTAVGGAVVGGLTALGGGSIVAGSLEAATAVGGVMGAVGAVTHDKGLMTAGAVIGGIGAVGSLASAAGLIGDGTSLFGDGANTAAQTATAADTVVPSDGGVPLNFSNAAGAAAPTDFTQSFTPQSVDVQNLPPIGEGTGEPPSDAVPPPNEIPAGVLNDTTTPSSVSSVATNANAPVPTMATMNGGLLSTPQTLSGVAVPLPQVSIPGGGAAPSVPSTSSTGYLDNLLSFANKNPAVSIGAIQAAGSFVSGMFNPLTPAQVAAANAQAANNRAAAAMTSTQTANIQSGVPGVKPVASAPVTGKVSPVGLLNSNPNIVTGAPAPLGV